MGHFTDLPKDVVWLIYRFVIRTVVFERCISLKPEQFEIPERPIWSPIGVLGITVAKLACVSKQSLNLCKSKCIMYPALALNGMGGFLFVNKSIS